MNIDLVLEKIKELGVFSDRELANALEITPRSVNNYRKRLGDQVKLDSQIIENGRKVNYYTVVKNNEDLFSYINNPMF